MAILPIRCIVVDDERPAAEHTATLVQNTQFLELAGMTTNPHEALEWVHAGMAELVLLDLSMPTLHGLEFIRMAGGKCRFIVATGFRDFAVEGFELDVLDYIMKPVTQERLIKAAGKAYAILRPSMNNDASFIKCLGRQSVQKVDHSELLFCQSESKQSKIVLKQNSFISPANLAELELLLPAAQFIRVHKSYIVSVKNIEMVRSNTITIRNVHIPIGSQYLEKFNKLMH